MSEVRLIEPVVRICGIIASQDEFIQAAIETLTAHWGGIHSRSPAIPFAAGGFYDDTMGRGLLKTLVAWTEPVDPAGLADWKRQTNVWETELATQLDAHVPRPVNLDPGYLSQAKLVLATIKDRDHRVYLHSGIFAEVTLNFVGGRWVHHRWTYPSYRTPEVARFADICRKRLREHLLANGLIRHV